jgi:two-component system, LytTR family, sensor kinase
MRSWTSAIAPAIAAAVAVAVSAQTYLSMRDHGHDFRRIIAWQLCCWLLWAVFAPVLLRRGAAFSEAGRYWRALVGLAVAVPVLIVAHMIIASQLTVVFQPYVPRTTYTFTEALEGHFISLLAIDVLVCGILAAVGYAAAQARRAQALALRESRLETELAHAHLDSLRMEIRPHFLFNTLNSISALIRLKQNDQALKMLVSLGELLRTSIDQAPRQLVALHEELEFVGRYVELQHARFADRVRVRHRFEINCMDVAVPSFLLQPLVENAFRHGAARSSAPCDIEIGARREGEELHVWVADDGAGLPDGFDVNAHAGTGLRNVRSRLAHLYGGAPTLTIGAREPQGTRVDIRLPARTAAEDLNRGSRFSKDPVEAA